MSGQRVVKLTAREEREAYELATLRDDDTCQRCRRSCGQGVTSRDHRKGRGVGGRTTPANLQVLGGTGTIGCHGWKTANPQVAMDEGWSVPGWADPLVWPARRWFRDGPILTLGWVLYLDRPNVVGSLWERIDDDEAARRMEGMVG